MGCIGIAARAALPIGFALLLGAVPQQARAGACQDAGLTFGCVVSGDIARNSLRAIDITNESQAYFGLGNDAFSIPTKKTSYVKVDFTPPADGFLIITGSATISAGDNGGVVCNFEIGNPDARRPKRILPRFGGAANTKFKPFDSMAWSTVEEVKGRKPRRVAMVCKPVDGAVINILRPGITVVFHPLRY